MEKEFIPYSESLALKELGFDEPCFGRYYYKESYPMLNPQSEETELVFEFGQYIKQTEDTILAPTFSQCFRWFREKYKMDSVIIRRVDRTGDNVGSSTSIPNRTYEEAELDCLNKLIEIVKSK